MVRDARRCRAPHHEDLEDLILRRRHRVRAKPGLMINSAPSRRMKAKHVPKGKQRQRASAAAVLGRVPDHFIGHLSWKRSWSSLTMVATVFSESWPSAS